MFETKTSDVFEMMIPYIKRQCWDIVDEYVKKKTAEYEKNLREVLEPELQSISVNTMRGLKEFGDTTEVILRIDEIKKKESGVKKET